jgi:hypothetical protein
MGGLVVPEERRKVHDLATASLQRWSEALSKMIMVAEDPTLDVPTAEAASKDYAASLQEIGELRSGRGSRRSAQRCRIAHRSVAISSKTRPGRPGQLPPPRSPPSRSTRLMHHAHVVVTDDDSCRYAQTRAGKG